MSKLNLKPQAQSLKQESLGPREHGQKLNKAGNLQAFALRSERK